MPTFNVELKSEKNKDGLHSVFIRVTHNRKHSRIKTGVSVPEDHFNKQAKYGKWIRTTNIRHLTHNTDIEKKLDELKAKYKALEETTSNPLKAIKAPIEKTIEVTYKSYMDQYLKAMELEAAVGYYRHVKSKLVRFSKFIGESTLMRDITRDHIKDYKASMQEKKLTGSTINDHLKRLRAFFEVAFDDEVITKDPFPKKIRVKETDPDPVRLSDEDIKKLEALVLPQDGKVNWQFHAHKMYLFAFYNAGIRISDTMQLRMGSVKNGRLEYEMDKTGHRKSIPLNDKSRAIFDLYFDPKAPKHHYLFPCLDNNAPYAEYVTYEQKKKMPRSLQVTLFNHCSSNATMINQALVKISEKIELDKPARFHSNRHSFADKARRKMKESRKVTLMDIKNSLGHKSVVTTERYMKRLDKESLDEAMGEIFD